VRRTVLVAAALVLLTGCSGGAPDSVTLDNRPIAPQSNVKVDTPELRALKADAGVVDCAPGPGGGQLPDFELPCLGGGTSVNLASLRGPMILSFWASWCDECAVEMPALEAFSQAHGDQVPVLGIDYADRYPASGLKTMQEFGATYPSLADPGGDAKGFVEFTKQLNYLPAIYFIDADGAIAYVNMGGVDSVSEMVDLVSEHLGVSL
jgi:thiol-disulfide isomerase/thioredoxin